MNSRIRTPFCIFFLNPVYVAARSLRSLRSNKLVRTETIFFEHFLIQTGLSTLNLKLNSSFKKGFETDAGFRSNFCSEWVIGFVIHYA